MDFLSSCLNVHDIQMKNGGAALRWPLVKTL